MPSRYGTLGAVVADQYHEGRRGDEIVLPPEDEMKKMPVNRAEARSYLRLLPRAVRREDFGAWRRRR